jgi:hypothetical protein
VPGSSVYGFLKKTWIVPIDAVKAPGDSEEIPVLVELPRTYRPLLGVFNAVNVMDGVATDASVTFA